MKIRAFLTAGLMIAALTGPSLALENPTSATRALLSRVGGAGLFQTVSCNVNDDDKQARCARDCDDTWIKATQAYHVDIEKARGEKKACEAKCGC